MTSRAYLSSPVDGGSFQISSGEVEPAPAARKTSRHLLESRETRVPNADQTPSRRPPTQSLEPGAGRRPDSGNSKTAARPDLDSAESGALGQQAGRAGRRARGTGTPCPQETPPAIPKLSLHQTHLWVLNIAGDDYPGRVHPGLGEGLRGKEVGSGGKIKLPFPPSFFLLLLVQNSVIFSTQIKQQLVRDAWVSTGMLVLGF